MPWCAGIFSVLQDEKRALKGAKRLRKGVIRECTEEDKERNAGGFRSLHQVDLGHGTAHKNVGGKGGRYEGGLLLDC